MVTSDWWAELSPEGKKEYIAEHPNSKYARKGVDEGVQKHENRESRRRKAAEEKKAADKAEQDRKAEEERKANAPKPKTFKEMIMKALPKLHPKEQEFWKDGGYKAGSEHRRKMGQLVKDKSKGVVSHLKHQAEEWKDGCKAIRKFAQRQELSEHDKKAMKALALDIVVTTASVAVSGGFGHGLVGLLQHYALDIVRDCSAKALFHGVVLSGTAIAAAKVDDEQMIKLVIDKLADYIENGDISEEQWLKGLESVSGKDDETDSDDSKE